MSLAGSPDRGNNGAVSMMPKQSLRRLWAVSFVVFVCAALWVFHRPRDEKNPPTVETEKLAQVSPAPEPITPLLPLARSNQFASESQIEFRLPPDKRPQADAVHEPAVAAFEQWVQRYREADTAARQSMEAEGVVLAQNRLAALAEMVPTQPRRALELTVPFAI